MLAVVYTSYTGHTKEYAELFGKETGLRVYEQKEAMKVLPEKTEILYFGWLMAGTVKGYKAAASCFSVKAVCAVGMASTQEQISEIYKVNGIPQDLAVFCLQGGFEMEKLHGIYKLMMRTMKATVGKSLAGKESKTASEEEMLELLMNGRNCVSQEKLKEVLQWYKDIAD